LPVWGKRKDQRNKKNVGFKNIKYLDKNVSNIIKYDNKTENVFKDEDGSLTKSKKGFVFKKKVLSSACKYTKNSLSELSYYICEKMAPTVRISGQTVKKFGNFSLNITNLDSNDSSIENNTKFDFKVMMNVSEKYLMSVNNETDLKMLSIRINDDLINETRTAVNIKIKVNSSFSSYVMKTSKN